MGTYTRLAERCEKCPLVDTCKNKRIEAMAYIVDDIDFTNRLGESLGHVQSVMYDENGQRTIYEKAVKDDKIDTMTYGLTKYGQEKISETALIMANVFDDVRLADGLVKTFGAVKSDGPMVPETISSTWKNDKLTHVGVIGGPHNRNLIQKLVEKNISEGLSIRPYNREENHEKK